MRFLRLTSLRSLWRDRRANALMLTAFALPFVIGAAGLGVHSIELSLMQRRLQREADSAAIAGGYSLYQGQSNSTATAAATEALSQNALVTGVTSTLTPTGSYTSGSTTFTKTMYVQLQATVSTPFMGIFGQGSKPIAAEARAAIVPEGDLCAIALQNAAVVGINVQGNANINLGCGAGTNALGANSKSSISRTGNSGTLVAEPLVAVGSVDDAFTGSTQIEGHVVISDPFSSLSLNPATNDVNNGACNNPNSPLTVASGATLTLANAPNPGCFTKIDIQGIAYLKSGTYFIVGTGNGNNTGFQVGASGQLHCSGCTFVLTKQGAQSNDTSISAAGTMSISGSAILDITSPTSGTYQGIFLYRDRRAPADTNGCCTVVGNTGGTLTGAIYAPNDQVTFTGNGTFSSNCLQILSATISFDGSATINNTFNSTTCPKLGNTSAWSLDVVRLIS
jgi:hypothetical protein